MGFKGYSKWSRRTRRQRRGSKRRGFAELRHRKWHKAPVPAWTKLGRRDVKWRRIKAMVEVGRVGYTGEGGRTKPYRAIACVGTRGGDATYPRLAAHRCGEARGTTPTKAIKAAFRDLARSFK
jgi:hypothetical protein